MRKTALWFFMAVFCATNSFGAADGVISRVIPGKNNIETTDSENTDDVSVSRSARRVNVSRKTTETDKTASRGATRSTVVKLNDSGARGTQKPNIVSRSGQKTTNRPTLNDGVNTVGRNPRTESAGINSLPSLRRAGIVLRSSTAEVGGRAKIIGSDTQTGSNIDDQVRSVHGRASIISSTKKQTTPTAESIAAAKDILEKTADLNNTCQQQYNECMDQFCAVVDANQKRCSCSANLDKYARVQKAVEDANSELNDVAQKIRYVGLSADEIHAILSATEAELAMSKTRDNTQTRSMLDDIADMIKDPTSSISYSTTSDGNLLLDMDFDFSSDSSDLFGLEMFTGSNDISSKRGKDLYKEATKRCKNVLNQCKDAGGTESQITGNYDLAIDKDCIAYEQGLDKLNKQLVSNVRSANLMLQKARLAVLENNNEYDIKGCVGALENCMLDDMVCGDNYVKCIDPTKRYIDENGSVVLGKNIANITAFMENYNNSNINDDFIKAASTDTTCPNGDGACIVNYLMTKIGTGQTVKDGGLCRAVLDKCKQFTYTGNTAKTQKYDPYNDVVVNYIQRAMVNIKASQAQIISDYASSCIADISTCYNQQINQINSLSTTANVNNIYSIMTGACYNVALTCGYAVFAYDADIGAQVNAASTESERQMILIRAISDLFYQSLLCPNNSTFVSSGEQTTSANRTIGGYVNTRCQCDEGYTVWGGACLATCATTEYRNSLGICSSCGDGLTPINTGARTMENNDCGTGGGTGGGSGGGSSDDNPWGTASGRI